jgi:hypothetical protein
MTAFVVRFSTDNSAFGEDDAGARVAETARILRAIADKLDVDAPTDGLVFDINGNSIGRYWED